MKKYILPALMLAAAFGPAAAENETMYLIKDNQVVAKYNVDDVDYASFHLPDGVVDSPLAVTVDATAKNSITYSVSTTESTTAYAHGILSEYDLWYGAMDAFGMSFDELDDASRLELLQAYLPYSAYLGVGSKTMTQNDWALDPQGYRMSVRPGTRYYVCAWQVDPVTEAPLDCFVYTEAKTLDAGESTGELAVSFKRQNAEGLAFDFNIADEFNYVVVIYGQKEVMDVYMQYYGKEITLNVFGQAWTAEDLAGMREDNPEIENATWPVDDAGDYILYARGVDANGDIKEVSVVATAEAVAGEGPEIKIWNRSKESGKVSVNFEISPSNVEEAYVRLMGMNMCDDRLNMGYALHELAMGGDATDVTSDINSMGEYTFTSTDVDDETWYTILIYGKDKDGHHTTLRMDFLTLEDSDWGDYDPVSKIAGKRRIARAPGLKARRPTLNKVVR